MFITVDDKLVDFFELSYCNIIDPPEDDLGVRLLGFPWNPLLWEELLCILGTLKVVSLAQCGQFTAINISN